MKIIIAPDSFKGSLSAIEVSNYIEMGIKNAFKDIKTIKLPVGDGGEGTMDILVSATGGRKKYTSVTGPLGNKVNASYGMLGDGKTCVIEMATTSGLHLVPAGQLSPLTTTTYGTGELIKHALDEGYNSFVIGLGGSATNDGGVGMLQALGMEEHTSKTIYYADAKIRFSMKWLDEDTISIVNRGLTKNTDRSLKLNVEKEIYHENGLACQSLLMKREYEVCYQER